MVASVEWHQQKRQAQKVRINHLHPNSNSLPASFKVQVEKIIQQLHQALYPLSFLAVMEMEEQERVPRVLSLNKTLPQWLKKEVNTRKIYLSKFLIFIIVSYKLKKTNSRSQKVQLKMQVLQRKVMSTICNSLLKIKLNKLIMIIQRC